jgi:hypothetical protein
VAVDVINVLSNIIFLCEVRIIVLQQNHFISLIILDGLGQPDFDHMEAIQLVVELRAQVDSSCMCRPFFLPKVIEISHLPLQQVDIVVHKVQPMSPVIKPDFSLAYLLVYSIEF